MLATGVPAVEANEPELAMRAAIEQVPFE